MSLARRWPYAATWLTALTAMGCGLLPVELGSHTDAAPADHADGDDIVIDEEISDSAIARLRADQSDAEHGSIALIYPATAALTLPANVAPITFEWGERKPGRSMAAATDPATPAATPPMAKMPAAPDAMPDPPAMMIAAPGPAANEASITYELRIRAQYTELHLFTNRSSAVVPANRWRALLGGNAEGALHVELRALRASGAIERAAPLELAIWTAPPAGTLYAWSTTARGLTHSGLELTHEQLVTPPSPIAADGSVPCLGCHAVSRDGKRILAAIGGSAGLASWSVLKNGMPLELPFDDAQPKPYVFGSFDPTDLTAARIAVTEAGRLLILDAYTGQVLQQSAWPMFATSDYPTWSPDGRSIALVLAPAAPTKAAAANRVLARIPVALDGSLGEPESLVQAMGDEVLLAPSYSPDGDWIAFERRKGKAQNPRDGTLWLLPASGGVPIELAAANGARMPSPGANSPTFIPGDVPGRAFLLFAAQRPVGSFMPADGQRQLFAAALNLQLAASGTDPSSPAFWLPFQQRTNSYLRGQWAPAVTASTPTPKVCDGSASRSDEDCCAPEPEICGNGDDEDCDGRSDEGCGCAFRELCDNQTDDDCDERVDEPACAPAPMQK